MKNLYDYTNEQIRYKNFSEEVRLVKETKAGTSYSKYTCTNKNGVTFREVPGLVGLGGAAVMGYVNGDRARPVIIGPATKPTIAKSSFTVSTNCVFIGKFGSAGSGNGQFNTLGGIDVDANYIYVADQKNYRIQIFNKSTYAFVGKFGSAGSGNGQFGIPPLCAIDVAVDGTYIYVEDTYNGYTQVFNKSTYAFVAKFGVSSTYSPYSVMVDDDYIYVSQGGTEIIIKYDKTSYTTQGTLGSGTSGLMVNNAGNIYIGNQSSNTNGLKILSKATGLVIGTIYSGTSIRAVAVDNGYIYIIRSGMHRIDIHDISTLAFVKFCGSGGSGDGLFNNPSDIAVYNDVFYVADQGNNRIQVFQWQ